jgi:hypothetical protein
MADYLEAQGRRWLSEKIDRLNAPHFTKKNKQPYQLEDFMGGPVSDKPQTAADVARLRARRLAGLPDSYDAARQAEQDHADLVFMKGRDARIEKLIRSGNFDESILPKWARMTDKEKAERGIN